MLALTRVFKDPISGLIHVGSALFALVGTGYLVAQTPAESTERMGAVVYGITFFLVFLASSMYHLIKAPPKWERRLRKFDHAAIYLFIAGTYTPVCLVLLENPKRWILLGTVWTVAVVGVALKVFMMHSIRWLSVAIYLAMGWLCVFVIQPLADALSLAGFLWLVTGGLLYTFGAIIYATKRFDFVPGVFGFHEVWHLFVSAASFAHFILIARYVL